MEEEKHQHCSCPNCGNKCEKKDGRCVCPNCQTECHEKCENCGKDDVDCIC